jgi:plastocyanin
MSSRPSQFPAPTHVSGFLAAATISIIVTLTLGARPRAGGTARAQEHNASHVTKPMTEAAMKRWSQSWWASHPRVGTASDQAPVATFTVANFIFDNDHNAGTQVDTVKITTGQTVLWQWVDGFHTLTNGSGASDPDAGTLFDQPSEPGHPQFSFTFNTAGKFPFFCRPHEGFGMTGVVLVSSTIDVGPFAGGALGFTVEPTPNPTQAGARFGFALRQPGRAHAEVLDVGGRLVKVIVDQELDAGPHTAAWDGLVGTGARAPTGVYYLRLRLPGFSGIRRVVIAH